MHLMRMRSADSHDLRYRDRILGGDVIGSFEFEVSLNAPARNAKRELAE
jgi:hypothetical protein